METPCNPCFLLPPDPIPTPWGQFNLLRLYTPVSQSNGDLSIAVKIFIDQIKAHNQLSLCKRDDSR